MNKFLFALWTMCFFGCASEVTPADGSDVAVVDVSTPDAVSEASAADTTDSATTDAQAEASADASDTVIADATDANDASDAACLVPPTVGPVSPTSVVGEVATTFVASYAGCAEIVRCDLVGDLSSLLGDMSLSSGTASLTLTLSTGMLRCKCNVSIRPGTGATVRPRRSTSS